MGAITDRGSIYTTIMESGPQNHNGDGLLGPNSIVVVYMDPLGNRQSSSVEPYRLKEQHDLDSDDEAAQNRPTRHM